MKMVKEWGHIKMKIEDTKMFTTLDVLDEDHYNDKQECSVAFCHVIPTTARLIIYLYDGSRIYIWLCSDHVLMLPEEIKSK